MKWPKISLFKRKTAQNTEETEEIGAEIKEGRELVKQLQQIERRKIKLLEDEINHQEARAKQRHITERLADLAAGAAGVMGGAGVKEQIPQVNPDLLIIKEIAGMFSQKTPPAQPAITPPAQPAKVDYKQYLTPDMLAKFRLMTPEEQEALVNKYLPDASDTIKAECLNSLNS